MNTALAAVGALGVPYEDRHSDEGRPAKTCNNDRSNLLVVSRE